MGIFVESLRTASSDGVHQLVGIAVRPVGKPCGILHIVHGMTEHISRYLPFMRRMAEKGFLTVGYDNLGHGYTAMGDEELGFIASENGDALLCKDVALFAAFVKEKYGNALPYTLLGHSMGSFIVRLTAEKHFTPDRLIIMGTGDKNPLSDAALFLVAAIRKKYGERHRSPLLDKLAFGSYNKRFAEECKAAPSPWLTTVREVRLKYANDRFCAFRFTVSAMGDLIRLQKNANRPAFYQNLSKDLPILLVSGREDPVGNYGKGVEAVFKKLKDSSHNVVCRIYEGARHEILNEHCREQVEKDILTFLG